jgi:hypothetical protein
MHDLNVATIFFGAIALAATVGWMIWTLRQAQISRRGPTDDVQSYLRHDKATGAIAMCVAVGGVVIAALIIREQPIPIWPGAIAGVVAIIVCERRWPRPSGSIRTVLLVAPRSSLRLVPWLGVALACIGWLAAAVVIAVCWMMGNSGGGRTISGNLPALEPGGLDDVVFVSGFPGWAVGLATVIGGVALLGTVAVGSLVVARRPVLRAVTPDLDLQFRQASIDRMVRIVAIASLMTASQFYSAARSTYEELQLRIGGGDTNEPFVWLLFACSFLILIAYLFNRPRPKVDSNTPVIRADLPV